MLALVAPAEMPGRAAGPLPAGYVVRSVREADTTALGELYFASYPPGVACATLEEALADIKATFAGEYGELWTPGSLVISAGHTLLGAALTVHRAPWPDTPDCPFIIELFTAPGHRRKGLARDLIHRVGHAAAETARPQVALRVADDNAPALGLYRSLGFQNIDTPLR